MTGGCPGSAEIRSSSCCFGKVAMAVVMVEEKKSKDMKSLRTTLWNTIGPSSKPTDPGIMIPGSELS